MVMFDMFFSFGFPSAARTDAGTRSGEHHRQQTDDV